MSEESKEPFEFQMPLLDQELLQEKIDQIEILQS